MGEEPPREARTPGGDPETSGRLEQLEQRLAALEQRFGNLLAERGRLAESAAAPGAPADVPVRRAPTDLRPIPAEARSDQRPRFSHGESEPAPRISSAASEPAPRISGGRPELAPRDSGGGPAPGAPSEDLEATIGLYWVSRVGLVLVLFALALFLKWAYDRNLISFQVRTALALLLGACLVTAGETLHRRAGRYAEAFTGAGLAAFYAAFFAAYQLYHLFSQGPSFAFMVVTTAAAALFAVRYDSVVIAALGIVGGFAVPFLLPGREARLEPMLVYYLILEAGVLATVPRLSRRREELLVLAAVAGFSAPVPAALGARSLLSVWLVYFFILAAGVGWLLPRERMLPPGAARWLIIVLAVLPFLAPTVVMPSDSNPALVAAYLCLTYMGFLVLCSRMKQLAGPLAPAATASALIALGISHGSGTALWWTVAGCGAIALAASIVATAADRATPHVALLIGGPLALGFLTVLPRSSLLAEAAFPVAMLLLFVAAPMRRPEPAPRDLPLILASPALFGGALWFLLARHDLETARGLLMLLMAVFYALAAATASRLRPDSLLLRLGFAGVGVTFLTLVFPAQFDTASVTMAWAVEAAVLILVGARLGLWVIRAGGAAILCLSFGRWLIFDAMLPWSPAGELRVPFANTRALAAAFVAAAAFAVAALYARLRRGASGWPPIEHAVEKLWAGGAAAILGNAAVLLAVSLEIHLAFERASGGLTTPGGRIGYPEIEQFVLTAYCAMHSIVLIAVGLWRSVRGARILGLLLFGATLCKAVSVDLKFLDTIYRVFSFLALGALLVAASLLYQRFRGRLVRAGAPTP